MIFAKARRVAHSPGDWCARSAGFVSAEVSARRHRLTLRGAKLGDAQRSPAHVVSDA